MKLSARLEKIAIKHGFLNPGTMSQDNLKTWNFLVDILKEVGKEDKEQARRFALLHAAATIFGPVGYSHDIVGYRSCITDAYELLNEIESRENDVKEV